MEDRDLEWVKRCRDDGFNVIVIGSGVGSYTREQIASVKGLRVLDHEWRPIHSRLPQNQAKGPRNKWGALK